MKNFNIKEVEKWIKRNLKNKISINEKTVVAFLLMGVVGLNLFADIAIKDTTNNQNVQGTNYDQGNSGTNSSVMIGADIVKGSIAGSVLIGTKARADENPDKTKSTESVVAIGKTARVGGNNATAIGAGAYAKGTESTAIGNALSPGGIYNNDNEANRAKGPVAHDTRTIAIGTQISTRGAKSIAIGDDSSTTQANSIAIGQGVRSMGSNSIAMGTSSKVSVEKGVALGADSVADRGAGVSGYMLGPSGEVANHGKTGKEWKSTLGALSIGSSTNTRQITGVAAGSEDTDAVNVAQLKGVSFKYYSIKSTENDFNSNLTNDKATGDNAMAIGPKASSSGNYGLSLGYNAISSGISGIALGHSANSTGDNSVAIGKEARTTGINAVAVGASSNANEYSTAVGQNAQATAIGSSSFGQDSTASGERTVAVGNNAKAIANHSIAMGYLVKANAKNSVVIGRNAETTGESSIIIGTAKDNGTSNSKSDADRTVVIGYENKVVDGTNHSYDTTVIGTKSTADNSHSSVVIGTRASITNAEGSVAIGKNVSVENKNSVAMGSTVSTKGENSIGIGANIAFAAANNHNTAIGSQINVGNNAQSSVALGRNVTINGESSMAMGNGANATANNTVAMGSSASAEGIYSVAVGHMSNVNSESSVAIGREATSTNSNNAVVIGKNSKAQGSTGAVVVGDGAESTSTHGSVAIGRGSKSTANSAIVIGARGAEGTKAATNVTGEWGIAIGNHTSVTSDSGIALGSQVSVTGTRSIAIGRGASASLNDTSAFGANAIANKWRGVALGADSVTTRTEGTRGYDILEAGTGSNNSNKNDSIWKATYSAVSVGKDAEITRQITGVAAGTQDTDAVNVAQLKQVQIKYNSDDVTANQKVTPISVGLKFRSENGSIGITAKDGGIVDFKVLTTPIDDKKITFKADNAVEFDRKNSEDKSVEIKAGDFSFGGGTGAADVYKAKNLRTQLTKTTDGAKIEIGLKDQVEFTKVTITNGTGGNGPILSTTGIDMRNQKISNLAAATQDHEAVRFDQLKNMINTVNNTKITFKDGTAGAGAKVALGETVIHKNEDNSKNIEVILDANGMPTYTYKIKENPEFTGKVKATNGFDANNQKIVNVANGTDNKDAVNYSQLKELEDKIAGNLSNVKAISLKSPAVYTYTDGGQDKIIVKVDGKYYAPEDLDENGKPKATATPVNVANGDVHVSIVNNSGTGSVNDPVNLRNIADGKISSTSKEAVNGSQLFNVADKLGIVNDDGTDKPMTLAAPKNVDGTSPAAPTNIVDAVNVVVAAINKGIMFAGNQAATNSDGKTQYLGSKLEVVAGDVGTTHLGKNLITEYKYDAGNGKISIGLKDNPEFKTVELKGTNGKDGRIGVDGDGNVVVTNGKNGTNAGTPSKVVTENTIANMNLSYKADKEDAKTTTLGTGLHFKAEGDANFTVSTEENGVVKYKLDVANDTINENPAAPTNKLVTENAVKDFVDKKTNALGSNWIKFTGDDNVEYTRNNNENKTIKVVSGEAATGTSGDNLSTKVETDGAEAGKIIIGLKKDLIVDSLKANKEVTSPAVNVGAKDGKHATLGVDTDGNLTVVNGKDGAAGAAGTTPAASKIVTENTIGDTAFTYKANTDDKTKKTTTLTQGLDFLAEGSPNFTVTTDNDGKVKYSLAVAETLTNDTTNPTNNTNKLVTEGAVRNFVANQLDAEKTRYVSINPSDIDKTKENSNYNNNGATGGASIAIGRYTKSQGDSSISLGYSALSTKENSIALGSYAAAEGKSSIALGTNVQTTGENTVAIGTFSKATVESGVALGTGSLANKEKNILGARFDSVNNDETLLNELGKKAEYDNLSIEIEKKKAEISKIDAEIKKLEDANQNADAKYQKRDELTNELKELASNQNKIISAWKSTLGAVSVGNSETGDTRQITGVAAGTEDTDAVNVAQLKHLGDREFTFTDGEADNNFVRKNSENDKKITIKAGDITTDYKGQNLKVSLEKTTGVFSIGLKENPEFKSLTLKGGANVVNMTPSAENTLKLSGADNNAPIKLTNLANGDVSKDSKDAINGSQLFDLKKELGLKKDPAETPKASTGPAGKDGLDGKSIVEKANALRDGLAGNQVYTKDDGTRVVKEGDKYYEADENGNKKDPATEVPKDKLIISTVNPDGTTTTPTALGNVASGLGLDGKDATGTGSAANPKAITPEKAKIAVEGLLTKEGSTNLNKVATVGDLQALAQAGLYFKGNVGNTHRALSQELIIQGKEGITSFTNYSTDNIATNVSEGKVEIGILKTPRFDAVELGAKPTDATATDNKITLTPDTNNSKLTFTTTVNGKDVTLDGTAKAEISDTSKQVINGAQLADLLKQLGLSVDTTTKTNLVDFTLTNKLQSVDGTAVNNPNNMADTINSIIAKINEGYKYGGDQTKAANDSVHRIGSKLEIKSATDTLTGTTGDKKDKTFVGKNLLTQYDYSAGNGVVAIGLSETPEFKEVTLKNGENTINLVTEEPNTLKLKGKNDTDTVKITNLTKGDISKNSTDAINGAQLYNLREELGLEKDPAKPEEKSNGIAGKDGLDGKSILDKMKALRDGTSGNTVYTLPNGDRVVRGKDGKLYKAADIENKVYVEGKGYIPEADKDNENTVVTAPLEKEQEDSIIISTVNPDGSTTTPIGIGNVASGLGLDGKNADGTDYNKPITAKEAKNVIAGTNGKDGLLNKTDGLNNVATVRDLQALSQAGLDFGANSGDDIHRPLGSKVSIVGNKDEFEKINAMPEEERKAKLDEYVAKFSDKNIITTTDTDKNEISIKLAERPEFKGIDVVDPAEPEEKVSIDPTGTTVAGKDDKGKFIKTVTGKDGIKITKSDKEDGTNNNSEPTNEYATYGLDGTTIHKENDRVEITSNEIKVTNNNPDNEKDRNTTSITKNKISIQKADGSDTVTIKGADGTNASTIVVKDKDGINGVTIDGKGSIMGLEARNPRTNQADYGVGANVGRAATEGAIKELTDALGIPGIGNNNPPEKSPENTPNGNDGLDNKTVKEKINAIRNGQAGPLVYTTPDGTRLVRDNDGNFYPMNDKGEPDTTKEIVKANDVILSAVGSDGKTSSPTTLSNVKSAFDGDKKANEKFVEASKNLTYELPYYNLKDDNRTEEEKKADNNKAVNKGDLINMALLGLNFEGNKGDSENIHRPIGGKVLVKGEGTDDIKNFASAKGNIQVVSENKGATLTVKLSDKLTNMESFETKDFSEDQDAENAIKSKSKLDKDGLKVDTKDGASTKVNAGNIEIKGADKEEPIKIDGNTGIITGVEVGESPTSAVNRGYVDGKIGQLEDAVNKNSRDIANLTKSTSKGIAGAMAQAGVKFQEIGINQAVVGAAVSNYRGQHGVAVGIQGAPTENVRVHGIVSATPGNGKGSNPGVTVGASWKFNLK